MNMLKKWLKKFFPKNEKFLNQNEININNANHFTGDVFEIDFKIRAIFGDSADLVTESISLGKQNGLLCYFQSLTDWEVIATKILEQMTAANLNDEEIVTEKNWNSLGNKIFSGTQHRFLSKDKDIIAAILNGEAVLFIDNLKQALAINVRKTDNRSIEEPTTQTIVRGPKEGFNENIETNISLIRRKIKNPALRFESHTIGDETATTIYIGYMDGIINKGILTEIQNRIKSIKTNAIFDSGTIEELLEDKSFTLFPLLYNTERPDIIAAHLLSGKFALFIDGSPFVLSAPTVFNDFLAISEDYYQKFFMGSFIRLIRYTSFLISTLLPAFFIAVITFHHELIPTPLMISLISQREGIPFPVVVEALAMEITFEILREAGIRMPRAIGGTISIVGGLVIGQAAVEAGIVSNIMVIIVALTAISSFVIPIYTFAVASRLLRFIFILLAATLGLYGVFLGMIWMVAHLASLRSFSVPYLAPFAPFSLQDQVDTFFRFPNWAMKWRPSFLETAEPEKHARLKSPSPPTTGDGEK